MIRKLRTPSVLFELHIDHTKFGPYVSPNDRNALFTLFLNDGRMASEWVPIPEFKTVNYGVEAVFSEAFILAYIPKLLAQSFASPIQHLPTQAELLDTDPFDGEH